MKRTVNMKGLSNILTQTIHLSFGQRIKMSFRHHGESRKRSEAENIMQTKKGKFRKSLVKQVREEQQEEKRQIQLKQKYQVTNPDIMVVEKSNTIKFMTKTVIALVKTVASIAIFLLSVVGLMALIYPETRNGLINQGWHLLGELRQMLPL